MTNHYHLPKDGVKERVCKNFFLATLNLNYSKVRYVVDHRSGKNVAKRDGRGRKTERTPAQQKNHDLVHEFIRKLPAVPSHYCRSSTSKKYLPQEFISKANVYRVLYQPFVAQKKTQDPTVKEVSLNKFITVFNEYNLSFHQPKKDKCVVCAVNGAAPEDHLLEKEATKTAKSEDYRAATEEPSHLILSFDL